MNNADYIWKWLFNKIKNNYGVAGLMGNLLAESSLNPENLQNSYERALGMSDQEYTNAVDNGSYTKDEFCNDSAGYGLAQWTHRDRKKGLYAAAKNAGTSIGNLDMQLNYLWQELGQYKSVMNTLLTAKSVREASDAVMLKYQIPADTSEKNCINRANLGQKYYNQYVGKQQIKNEKADRIIYLAKAHIGCQYVYGAIGKAQDGKDSEQINLTRVFDCRGFTYWLLQQVGIKISTVGATTQYKTKSDWVEQGKINAMPNVVCPVFKYNSSDGKMSHTGMHLGDGIILHCTTKGGVKYGSIADTSWTHYAIPKGLYTTEELKQAGQVILMTTLRLGSSGDSVKKLQTWLNELGYNTGTPDGKFGAMTKIAVMAFQSDHNLAVDGVVGAQTWSTLENLIQKKQPEEQEDKWENEDKDEDEDMILIPRSTAKKIYDLLAPYFNN